MTKNEAVLFICIIGISISGMLGIAFFKNLKKPYVFLGIIFLSICFQLIEEYLWISHKILELPIFAELSEGAVFLIPPSLLFYTLHHKETPLKNHIFIHFLPAVVAFCNFLPLYLSKIGYKLCYIREEIFETVGPQCLDGYDERNALLFPEEILDIVSILQFVIYGVLILKNWKFISSLKSKKTSLVFQKWGKIIVIGFGLSIVFQLLDILYFTESENYFTILYLTSIVISFGIYIINQSILLEDNLQSNVYQNLKDTEVNEIYNKINQTILENELYKQEDINLSTLAAILQISSNQLSFVLNKKGTRFKELLNHIRITKSLTYLTSKEARNFSIEGIARQLGYKSKTTFYKHFKERTGKTPKEYMDSL